jgi:6-hydroxytryprostatin B O-methyltransferase
MSVNSRNHLMCTNFMQVGGSSGHLAIELATKHPKLSVTVQDLPTLKQQFEDNLPPSLKSRVSFQVHDFMKPQKIPADVYFYRFIFHDWPDNMSVQIIQNNVPAMKRGSRIIVMDGVMPEPGETSNFVLRMNTSMDLQMMAAFNAKERRKEDWINLFREADKRLVVKQFLQPRGSALTLIEVVLDG